MDFSTDIENALKVLKQGGLILYPTDTIWGIGCDATNEEAVEKVFVVKNRPSNKSLIILVADERDVIQYVANPDLRVFDYLQGTNKPTTVIYEGAIGLAPSLVNEDGSIAIRIVKDEFCRHLIKRFRKPIVSTSANISGEAAPAFFSAIKEDVKNGVDYTVKYKQGDMTPASPSAVIKWNKDGSASVLRP